MHVAHVFVSKLLNARAARPGCWSGTRGRNQRYPCKCFSNMAKMNSESSVGKFLQKKKKLLGSCELWFNNTLLKQHVFICVLQFCGRIHSPGVRKGLCTLCIKIVEYMHFIILTWRGGASYSVSSINTYCVSICARTLMTFVLTWLLTVAWQMCSTWNI